MKTKRSPQRVDFSEKREEPFLTLRAVAQAVGFHPVTLWRWGVPGHKIGARKRYLLSEVRAWLEDGGPDNE